MGVRSLTIVLVLLLIAPAAARAGSISGTVRGPSAEPVLTVVAASLAGGGPETTVFTDASTGKYTLDDLPSGDYVLRTLGTDDYLEQYFDGAATRADADPVSIGPATKATADFALVAAGHITGTVTGPGDDGVPGAYVTVLTTGAATVVSATADGDGKYDVGGLATGTYRLAFQETQQGGVDLLPEFYDNQTTFETSTDVPVTAGATTMGRNAKLAAGGSIAGTVTGGGGPVAGAKVSVYDSADSFVKKVTTDTQGHYRAGALPTGSYRLRAEADGFGTEYYDGKTSLSAADPISVVVGATTPGKDVSLSSEGFMSGTVTGPGDLPLEDVTVTAYDGAGVVVSAAETGAGGTYTLDGLAQGFYRVGFAAAGFVTEYYDDQATLSAAPGLGVLAGVTRTGVDAELAIAPTISGTVTGPGGTAVKGAAVVLIQDISAVANEVTGAAGEYTFVAQPGTYRLEFLAEGLQTEYFDDAPGLDTATPITVAAGGSFDADAVLGEVVPVASASPSPDPSPAPSGSVSPSPSPAPTSTPAPPAAETVSLSGSRKIRVRKRRFKLTLLCGPSGCTVDVFGTVRRKGRPRRIRIASGSAGAGGGIVSLKVSRSGARLLRKRGTKVRAVIAPKLPGKQQTVTLTLKKR